MIEEKIKYLKNLFPKKMYSIPELMMEFSVSRDTVYYWLEKFETGTIQITATPFIPRDSLIIMILKAENQKKFKGITAAVKDSLDLAGVEENPELLNIPLSPKKVLTFEKKCDIGEI